MLGFCEHATEFVRDEDDDGQRHNVDVFSLTLSGKVLQKSVSTVGYWDLQK